MAMKTKTEFPRSTRLIRNEWIPMADGAKLAARIWLPEDALEDPVPAILEYIPYRKSDGTAAGDAVTHGYFAGHGYASLRVDIRGAGDSEGVLVDEYAPQEQRDALDVLAWLADQPWCTGKVGMMGISWGGFNSLQVAALKPPQLKAIISVCSTDDRYANDEHYMGGCIVASEMGQWATQLLAYRGLPPDPDVVGPRWREMWLERLQALEQPTLMRWLAHQRRDEYWKHGSVCEDYAAMECAVYMVGGWQDGYRDAILRLLEHYPGPRKGLIGPWGHDYPHEAGPGPAVGFLQEALRWWDYWLKGIDTGIMDEPMLRVWMQEPLRPDEQPRERRGRWVAEPGWPSPAVSPRSLPLGGHGLGTACGPRGKVAVGSPPELGLDGGCWISWILPSDFPADQRADDGASLSFTSDPLTEDLELHGTPEAALTVVSDRPQALLCARLCDVWPDGASTMITRGALNLAHRDGHERPEPLSPGTAYRVRLPLQAIAYALRRGHRLRLAISTSFWPLLWPSPQRATIEIDLERGAELLLPARATQVSDDALPPFAEPEGAPALEQEVLEAPMSHRVTCRDASTGAIEVTWDQDMLGSRRFLGDGLEYREGGRETYDIAAGKPLSASVTSEWWTTIGRGDWRTRVATVARVGGDENVFHVWSRLDAFEGDVLVFSRSWNEDMARDNV